MRPALATILAIVLVGCGSGAPSTPPPASGGASAALPDLNLANVKTEAGKGRGATIGPDGGTISATGANGTTYTLTIPEGALGDATAVGLYPVAKVATLAADAGLVAGVQFSPDGLHLLLPASLVIAPPAGTDTTKWIAYRWDGDGSGPHPSPAGSAGGALTLSVLHFSGAGAGNLPLAPLTVAGLCDSVAAMDTRIETQHAAGVREPSEYATSLAGCYDTLVLPLMQASEKYAEANDWAFTPGADPDLVERWPAYDAYNTWLEDIAIVDGWLGATGTFSVRPEVDDSKLPAKNMLRAWYDAINDKCIGHGDPGSDTAFADADLVLAAEAIDQQRLAELWGVASVFNKLDLETLLNDLCAQIVVDPGRSYSAARPGDTGQLAVPVGYTIAGGPVRHDKDLQVDYGLTGSAATESTFVIAGATPVAKADLVWPAGLDPIRIDVLVHFSQAPVLHAIARFDRITKRAGPGRIAFTSMGPGGLYALSVMDPDGGNVRRLISSGNGGAAWSPDGTRLAISEMGPDGKPGIEVVSNVDDASTAPVVTGVAGTNGGVRPSWLPDGRILFEIGGHGLWVVEEDGTGLQQLITAGFGASASPDGREIAYVLATGQPGSPAYEIHARTADGTTDRTVLKEPGIGPQMVAWSPDGASLAFYGWTLPDGRYDVFVINRDGSGRRKLTSSGQGTGSFAPSWSPDGKRIAFASDRTGSVGIYVMNADGTDQQLVLANALQPAWQP